MHSPMAALSLFLSLQRNMDGCKFYCFIYFVVAVGLVTPTRGKVTSSTGANPTNASITNAWQPEDLSTVKVAVPREKNAATAFPKSTVHLSITPDSEICIAGIHIGKDQMGLFLIILAVLVIVCIILLVVAVALACKVCHLQGQVRGNLSPRSNGAENWGSSQVGKEVAGTDGTETIVMLEEVKLVKDEETAQPGPTDKVGNSGEANGGPNPPAPASEPAPAAEPEPDKSPSEQTTPPTTSEPATDQA